MKEAGRPIDLKSIKTKKEFNHAVRGKVMEILQGRCCGFTCTAYKSADGLDVLVRILLDRKEAQLAIAEQEGLRVKLRPEAYTECRQKIPRDAFAKGRFVDDAKVVVDHVTLSKKTEAIADLNWREVDLIRMVRRRMSTFIDIDKLIASGAASDCFPSHTYKGLQRLHDSKWNDIRAIFQWPGTQHVDIVRDYFGEEIGFFFHWLNFFTRYLVVAGSIGGLVFIIEHVINVFITEDADDVDPSTDPRFSDENSLLQWPNGDYHSAYVRLIFTLFMCLWGAVYTKHYQRRSNFKIMEWGMKDYSVAAKIRPKYDPKYRGSIWDMAQRMAHWVLVFIFILETIIVVFLVSNWRAYLSANEHKLVVFGLMEGRKAKKFLPNFLITVNIKLVDQVWKRLSPALTERENWRTEQELKNSKVIKMCIVKFNVYYYPFLFIAFLQEHWQDDATADTCLEELRQQILIYFPVQVAFTICETVWDLWKAKRVLTTRLKDASKIFHTELQANSPHYEDGIEDTMELILSFGFLMMFTTSVVVMPLLALLSNLVQIRLIAFRLSFANQRVPPRGQEGFGAWADIVQFFSFAGVVVNAGEAAFVMKPLRGLPQAHKLAWFLLFQNSLILVKLFIKTTVPAISDNQKFIEEHNSQAVEIIQWQSRHSKEENGLADHIEVNDKITKVDLDDPSTWRAYV